jgi:DNA topoisomerase-1
LDRAEELILQKREDDLAKIIKLFPENEDVQLLNGRWGAYLKIGKDNFKLPKDIVVEDLTLEECIEISENQPVGRRKAPAKGAAKTKVVAAKKPAAKKPAAKKAVAKKPVAKKATAAKKPAAKKTTK